MSDVRKLLEERSSQSNSAKPMVQRFSGKITTPMGIQCVTRLTITIASQKRRGLVQYK